MRRVKMSRRPVVLLGFARPEILSRQVQFLDQRDDVNAVFFENRRAGQIDSRHAQVFDFVGDRGVRSGQKAGAHAVRDVSQSQIETGRLNMVRVDCGRGTDDVRERSGC